MAFGFNLSALNQLPNSGVSGYGPGGVEPPAPVEQNQPGGFQMPNSGSQPLPGQPEWNGGVVMSPGAMGEQPEGPMYQPNPNYPAPGQGGVFGGGASMGPNRAMMPPGAQHASPMGLQHGIFDRFLHDYFGGLGSLNQRAGSFQIGPYGTPR